MTFGMLFTSCLPEFDFQFSNATINQIATVIQTRESTHEVYTTSSITISKMPWYQWMVGI